MPHKAILIMANQKTDLFRTDYDRQIGNEYKAKVEQFYAVANDCSRPFVKIENRTTILVCDDSGNEVIFNPELAKYIHRLFTLINP